MASFDSLLTNQDETPGWFTLLFKNYRNLDSTSARVKDFSKLTSDIEKFKFIRDDPQASRYIQNSFEENSNKFIKCHLAAEKHRQAGNRAFQKGDFPSAFRLYTLSIKSVPQDKTKDLSISVANRSAALYHLELYQEALSDIAWCLKVGYSKSLHYKVKDREARCLLALKQHLKALEAFRGTLQALEDADLSLDRRRKWQMDVQIMMAMLEKTPHISNEVLVNSPSAQLPSLAKGKHQALPAASSLIGVRFEQELGRYTKAEKPIKTGDTLIVEKPICAVLLAEHRDTHCFQCFKRLVAAVPCPNCTAVLFCASSCLEKALNTHHRYECPSLSALWLSGASVTCFMTLRLISQRSPQSWTSLETILEKDDSSPDSSERLLLFSGDDYRAVNRLVRHSSIRSNEDIFHRANMALVLYKCLENGGYFEGMKEDQISFIGGLLLRNLQALQFNAHEIFEFQESTDNDSTSRTVFLGGGLYPTLALFNHSCEPSVTRYFVGTTVVARAVRPIRIGEHIGENYGPIFTQEPKIVRQEKLRNQYWFDCHCRACIEDWPLFGEMPMDILRFRCESCPCVIIVPKETPDFMVKCSSCSKYTNLLGGLKALQDTDAGFKTGSRLLKEKNIPKALEEFTKILDLLDSTLAPPFRDYHLCQQAVRQCFLRCGNKN